MKKLIMALILSILLVSCTQFANVKKDTCEDRGTVDGHPIASCEIEKNLK